MKMSKRQYFIKQGKDQYYFVIEKQGDQEYEIAQFSNLFQGAKFVNAVNTIDDACECLFQCQLLLNHLKVDQFENLTERQFVKFMKKTSNLIIEAQTGRVADDIGQCDNPKHFKKVKR